MATVDENGFMILRIMREKGWVEGGGQTISTLKSLVGLNDAEFDLAEKWLSSGGYMDRLGSRDAPCWITPAGMAYVNREMATRLSLSVDAERVLKYVESSEPPPPSLHVMGGSRNLNEVHPQNIRNALSLNSDDLNEALQELEDEGLACSAVENQNITSGWGIRTTDEGRRAIRRNFRISLPSAPQIGAIFQGPVSATNLVNAFHSQIDQVIISSNDPEALRKTIAETLDSAVKRVADDLNLNQKAAYTQVASQLQEEVKKTAPDPTTLRRLMNILSFGDTLDGTLELGVKAFAVSAAVAPHIAILYECIGRLVGLGG